MAIANYLLYRNYDDSDTTSNRSYYNVTGLPSIEDLGWNAPAGKKFKEWNKARDGSKDSYAVGEIVVSAGSFYVIWEDAIHLNDAASVAFSKALYDDLRERIENHEVETATLAEIQLIIDNYSEEDEGMVVNATFGAIIGEAWFKTDMDASDIATAFMSGKNVIVHCIGTEESKSYSVSDTYLQMVGYTPEVTIDPNTYPDNFLFVTSGGICHSPAFSLNLLTSTHVGSDGKLYIDVYID